MGVKEIAHTIRGRGPENHFLFFKQQQALRNGSVRLRGPLQAGAGPGKAKLGAQLPVLSEPRNESCFAVPSPDVRPSRRLQDKWPRSRNLEAFRSLVRAGASWGPRCWTGNRHLSSCGLSAFAARPQGHLSL